MVVVSEVSNPCGATAEHPGLKVPHHHVPVPNSLKSFSKFKTFRNDKASTTNAKKQAPLAKKKVQPYPLEINKNA